MKGILTAGIDLGETRRYDLNKSGLPLHGRAVVSGMSILGISMKHITVTQTGGSPDAFKAAFIRALQETIESKVKEILLLVPQKSQLEHGIIEDVLGEALVKRLRKNEAVPYGDFNVTIRARTLRTVEMSPKSEVIIGAYLKPLEFEGILKMAFDTVAAIYVPWMDEELEAWKLKDAELIDVPEYLARLEKKS